MSYPSDQAPSNLDLEQQLAYNYSFSMLNQPTPQEQSIQCELEDKELWTRFHELGNEMVLTKSGR